MPNETMPTTATPKRPDPVLLPCPFCGTTKFHWHGTKPEVPVITHELSCYLPRLSILATPDSVAAWQNRNQPTPTPQGA